MTWPPGGRADCLHPIWQRDSGVPPLTRGVIVGLTFPHSEPSQKEAPEHCLRLPFGRNLECFLLALGLEGGLFGGQNRDPVGVGGC